MLGLAAALQRNTDQRLGCSVSRADLGGALQPGDGVGGIASLQGEQAEPMQGLETLRLAINDFPITDCGLVSLPLLMARICPAAVRTS